jgi:hypothetical protein
MICNSLQEVNETIWTAKLYDYKRLSVDNGSDLTHLRFFSLLFVQLIYNMFYKWLCSIFLGKELQYIYYFVIYFPVPFCYCSTFLLLLILIFLQKPYILIVRWVQELYLHLVPNWEYMIVFFLNKSGNKAIDFIEIIKFYIHHLKYFLNTSTFKFYRAYKNKHHVG